MMRCEFTARFFVWIRCLPLLIGLVFSGVGGCVDAQMADTVRQADSACANCHRAIYQSYLKTPMANASGPASDVAIPATFYDASSGVTYHLSNGNDGVWLRYTRTTGFRLTGGYRLDYYLGSGHRGRSYLYSVNDYLFEAPLSYYAGKHGYDLRPGYAGAKEMPAALPLNQKCLVCHMSGVKPADSGTVNRYTALPFLHGGITCEACHGDTALHVSKDGHGGLLRLGSLAPAQRDSLCLSCHLEAETSVPRKGRTLSDFRPGDSLTDIMTYFVHAGDAASSGRAVSEVEALNESACKRASDDRMSCLSCHDPHANPSPAARIAFYRAKCLACHTQKKFITSHYTQTPDCTRCHMPKSSTQDIPHAQVTDHRILRVQSRPGQNPNGQDETLVPVPGVAEVVTSRDLGLAYYNLGLSGDGEAMQRAWKILPDVAASDADDLQVLAALGFMARARGDGTLSARYLSAAYKLDPKDVYVANDLGVLLALSGNEKGAETLWQDLFARNQDLVDLGNNLALLECRLGDRGAAESTLQQVLVYSPDHQATRQMLAGIQSGTRPCTIK